MTNLPEIRYARNGGVHLAYATWGAGEANLVVIPGFVSHLETIWSHPRPAAYYERLGTFARVVVMDRRGMGLSDPVSESDIPDLETRMTDLLAVMDAAGVESASLYGISEGGPMAALFAATYPERVDSLILHGAMARTTHSDDHPWLPAVDAYVESAAELILPAWGTGAGVELSSPSVADDPDVVAFYARLERSALSPGLIAATALMFYDTDVRSVLSAIHVPTLVLHRRGDRLVNVRSGRYLADHIPNARMVEIPGIDHTAWFEHPEAFLDEIEEFVTGRRPSAVVDRRLATVLFSDIVGSTETAAAIGDAEWHARLEAHNRVVRAELERFGGREQKNLGDGFLATFDGPASAIRCACAISRATAALGVSVRIGLHTGEIEVIGDDIGGLTVHIAARVAGLAGADEVLVSRTVKDLVAGSGVAFESRGTHTLKGVPDEWELLAVPTTQA